MEEKPGMIYLASPYSHPEERIRKSRFDAVCRAAAHLMEREGKLVFSPIAHSHPIEGWMGATHDTEWWLRQDMPYMEMCSSLYVLMLPGWDISKGVTVERQWFESQGRPVILMEPV